MVDDEALKEFLVESYEGLDRLDREFVALEDEPDAPERIATIFRAIHTIKGTSGFLGLRRLESLTHAGESLLSLLRDGTAKLNAEMASALLEMVDRVRASLRSIEETGRESEDECHDVIARLTASRNRASTQDLSLAQPALGETPSAEPAEPTPEPALPSDPANFDAPPSPRPEPASREQVVSVRPKPAVRSEGRKSTRATTPPKPRAVSSRPAPAPAAAAAEPPSSISDRNVRVDVGLLDKLMNLVGELVLARNQMVQFGARIEDPTFVSASQRLNLITTELQEHVMKTRMQPIGNVWSKLPRVVRDLAVSCGKQVRVEMIGKETELDRTILEAIKDPLTHMVRNAVDHGLELPEKRAQMGKPKTGTLTLRAFHEGGQVNIEISDDGAGISHEAIRRKAVERKLISEDRAARLGEYELTQLIFLPGFSTAEKVTNISGRGVGMDVVKTNIERIGGTIDLTTRPGVGTSVRIRIPLTLAIVPALIVVSAGERFAIPQTNLLELVRLESDEAQQQVEFVHGVPVYRLRGQLLPLMHLDRALGLVPATSKPSEGAVNIIVLQADDRQVGLVVDEVRDTEEIVVKPLGNELKGISVFAGATIMGDGCVALILDVVGLAQHAGAINRHRDRAKLAESKVHGGGGLEGAQDKQTLLLFAAEEGRTMALPLSLVARLEEFDAGRVERSSRGQVVQYRGEILQLIEVSDFGAHDAGAGTPLSVIVYARGERSVGLVVRRILDVVEDFVRIERGASDSIMQGAAIIQGKVVDILDVESVVRMHAPWIFEGEAA